MRRGTVSNAGSPWPLRAHQQSEWFIRYKVIDSYFANNRRIASSGTGARLEYKDLDPTFLEMAGTKVIAEPVVIERAQTKRTYLHPVEGSEAAKIDAGLFMKPQRA